MKLDKNVRSIQESIKSIQEKANIRSKKDEAIIVSTVDVSMEAAKTAMKTEFLIEKIKLESNVKMSKVALHSSNALIHKAKEVRSLKVKNALIAAGTGCSLEWKSDKERRSPRIQNCRNAGPAIRNFDVPKKRLGSVQQHTRRRKRSEETATVQPQKLMQQRRQNEETDLRPQDVDTSEMEKRNGLRQRGSSAESNRRRSNEQRVEERNKLHQRGQAKSQRTTPAERKELQGHEKIRDVEKKNGIKSKNSKDNLKRKEKKSGDKKKKGKTSSVAKQEMKHFVMKQILNEDGDENAASGFGEMGGNIIASGAKSTIKNAVSLAAKAMRKVVWWILVAIFNVLNSLISSVVSEIIGILAVIWPVLLVGVAVLYFLAKIVGFFGLTKNEDFVGYKFKEYIAEIEAEMEDADEIEYHVAGSSNEDIYMNQDDMLLIYLAKMSDFSTRKSIDELEGKIKENPDEINGKVEESVSAGDIDTAPFLIVDTDSEFEALDSIIKDMLYYKVEVYTDYIEVTVTPTPTNTPTPEPTVSPSPTRSQESAMPSLVPTPVPVISMTLSEAPKVTTVTPSPPPESIITTIPVEVKKVDIYMCTADEWFSDHKWSFNDTQAEMYRLLLKMFESRGYRPGGGSTICDSY